MFGWQEEDIIKGCKKNKRNAQTALYEKYAPMLRGITYRYLSGADVANDLVHDALIQIISKIKQFKGQGSFEGWMKRITINIILTYFKKQKRLSAFDEAFMTDKEEQLDENFFAEILEKTSQEEIINLINELPVGYKTVFNLYVFENYSHKEIADSLNISISTSKSQLMRARKTLKENLTTLLKERNFEIVK